MTNPEAPNEHPAWEGAISVLLAGIDFGLIERNAIIPNFEQACRQLLQRGLLNNLGEVQAFLRKCGAPVQFVAKPFKLSEMPSPDFQCFDAVTGEPRSHWLKMIVSRDQSLVTRELQSLSRSDEINETILARDTGMLAIIR